MDTGLLHTLSPGHLLTRGGFRLCTELSPAERLLLVEKPEEILMMV